MGRGMDSPYRTNEAPRDVISTTGREDKVCSMSRGVCRKRVGALLTVLGVLTLGGMFTAGALTGALVTAPRKVLLRCATDPEPDLGARVHLLPHSAPPPPARGVAFHLPAPGAGLLETTEPQTHDPWALFSRARALESAGLPLHVSEVDLPAISLSDAAPLQVHATPVTTGAGSSGVELATIPTGSLLARAGMKQGDVVLSINGYSAARSEWMDHVWNAGARERGGHVVVELVRRGQREVVSIRWTPAR